MLQQWWNDPRYRPRLFFVVAALLFVVVIATLTRGPSAQVGAQASAAATAASASSSAATSIAPTAAPATAAPTSAPPAATAQPPVVVPPPAPGTFRNGTFAVGADIAAGTYRTRTASTGCSWARMNAAGQVLGSAGSDGPELVTLLPTDRLFRSSSCAEWTLNLTQIGNSTIGPHTDGAWLVTIDLAPGVWRASSAGCVWSRLADYTGAATSVIASGKTTAANQSIEIFATDRALRAVNCGLLTRAG